MTPTWRLQETYRPDLTRFVLPRFGTYRLGHIPADEIENWLNDEIDAGIAPSSVHRHYRTLRRLLQVAVEKQKIAANPCDRVDPPRVPKREMVLLDWDEVMALSDKLVERHFTMILFAVDTGMRWSEIIGLRRQKLDLVNRKVRVTEQLVRLEDGKFIRREPTTAAGVRSISISPHTAALVAEHIDKFTEAGGQGRAGVHERFGGTDQFLEFPHSPLRPGEEGRRTGVSLPRSAAHECRSKWHPDRLGSVLRRLPAEESEAVFMRSLAAV